MGIGWTFVCRFSVRRLTNLQERMCECTVEQSTEIMEKQRNGYTFFYTRFLTRYAFKQQLRWQRARKPLTYQEPTCIILYEILGVV